MKYYQDMEARYRADTYGGETPEETLQLFIDALKKGDIELASKYFVIEDQEKFSEDLEEMKNEDNFARAQADFKKLQLSKNDGERAFFTITNEKNVVEVQVILYRNEVTGKWKIAEL